MKIFVTTHTSGVGGFITAVTGSTGDYDLTLDDGTTVEGYDETAGSFSTDAPLPGDLFIYGEDGSGRLLASADQDVVPAKTASKFFRFKDVTLPTLASSDPAHEETDVAIDANVDLTFSKAMAIADSDGIVLSDTATSTPVASAVSVSGTVVTINPTGNLTNSTEYKVVVSAAALDDLAGNSFAGIASGALTFTTIAA